MWQDLCKSLIVELPRFFSSLVLLGLAWGVTQRVSVIWNLRQKRRENDLASARDFHTVYGDFFAIWKVWNYFRRDVGAGAFPQASRWELLVRASNAEGKLESTILRLACEKDLSVEDLEHLGKFRQLYQKLRQAIRDDRALEWNSSEDSQYLEFKRLAPLIAAKFAPQVGPYDAGAAMREITSNKWEHVFDR